MRGKKPPGGWSFACIEIEQIVTVILSTNTSKRWWRAVTLM